jgi:hypothetical protein
MGELNLSNIILYAKNNNSNKVLLKGLINIGIQYGTILELDISKITE